MRFDAQMVLNQINSLLAEYGELVDDEVLRSDMIEGSTDMVEFLRRVERARQEASVHSEALDANIKELKARKFRLERREQAMRSLALRLLFAADLEKLQIPEATYSVRNVPPAVIILNEDRLPDAACRFRREPNKTAIKSMLEVGSVEGACMSNGSKTLSIRIR